MKTLGKLVVAATLVATMWVGPAFHMIGMGESSIGKDPVTDRCSTVPLQEDRISGVIMWRGQGPMISKPSFIATIHTLDPTIGLSLRYAGELVSKDCSPRNKSILHTASVDN